MTIRTQTRSPGTVVSDDSIGTRPWSDPEKAKVEDNDPATATGPGISEWLKCTGYDFSTVPGTATPQTCTFPLRRRNGNPATTPSVAEVGASAQGDGASGGVSASTTVNAPAGTEDGDLLLAAVVGNGIAPITITTVPAGWAELRTATDSAGRRYSLYWKVADSNEDSGTWGITTSTDGSAIPSIRGKVLRVADARDTTPITASSPMNVTHGITSHQANQVTTTVDGCLVLSIFLSFSNATFSTPSGTTEETDANGLAVFAHEQTLAGSTGNKASTSSGTVSVAALQVAIAPNQQDVIDSAVRLVVGDVIGDDDYSLPAPWGPAYQVNLITVDVSDLDLSDIDADFGIALSAEIEGAGEADVDHAPATLTYEVEVDVSPTSGSTIGTAAATETWDAEVGGSPITQASYRYQLYGPLPATTLVYDSGEIASATQEHVIGSGTPAVPWASPQNNAQYTRRITVWEDGSADPDGIGDPISGVSEDTITTDWTPLPAITGLTATAVTEEA